MEKRLTCDVSPCIVECKQFPPQDEARKRVLTALLNHRWWSADLRASWICDEVAELTRALRCADPLHLCEGILGAPENEYEPEAIAFLMHGCGANPFKNCEGASSHRGAGHLSRPNVASFLSAPPENIWTMQLTVPSSVGFEGNVVAAAPHERCRAFEPDGLILTSPTRRPAPAISEQKQRWKSGALESADEVDQAPEAQPLIEATETAPLGEVVDILLLVCSTLFDIPATDPAWNSLRADAALHAVAQSCLRKVRSFVRHELGLSSEISSEKSNRLHPCAAQREEEFLEGPTSKDVERFSRGARPVMLL